MSTVKTFIGNIKGKDGAGAYVGDYSTEEKVVGTWIDGKPLYRKVILTASVNKVNTSKTIYDCGLLNIDKCVRLDGYITDGSSNMNINQCYSSTEIVWTNYIKTSWDTSTVSNESIVMKANNSSFLNKSTVIIIEYTKTTDTATIPIDESAGISTQSDDDEPDYPSTEDDLS